MNLSGGIPVSGLPERFGDFAYEAILGIPAPFVVALVVLAVSHFTLRYTRFGRQIYAVGGNQEAARLSGIQINRVKVLAYVFCSFFAAIGSIVLTARVASGQPTLGVSLPLESVAAVVLGGVSLFGGRGSVDRRGVRRGLCEHPVKRAQSPKRFVLHANDGDRRCAYFGGRHGSAVGEATEQLGIDTSN